MVLICHLFKHSHSGAKRILCTSQGFFIRSTGQHCEIELCALRDIFFKKCYEGATAIVFLGVLFYLIHQWYAFIKE